MREGELGLVADELRSKVTREGARQKLVDEFDMELRRRCRGGLLSARCRDR
jgi:hypothetical protein